MPKPKSPPPTKNKGTQTPIIENTNQGNMASSLLSSIEKLRGRENYSSWKFSMENYLALEDLAECLTKERCEGEKCNYF